MVLYYIHYIYILIFFFIKFIALFSCEVSYFFFKADMKLYRGMDEKGKLGVQYIRLAN